MLQTLPIALAQVKAGNTSENLLNKIRKIIYFLYGVKKKMKSEKLYIFCKSTNNILNSIKL